jgi:glycosyltransferase involved in cell wall biosynthesis
MPTTIDTTYHVANDLKKEEHKICIGWTGTSTTLKHFETIIPILKRIKAKYNDNVYFKVIVNFPYVVRELELTASKWNLSTEIEDLQEFDIGIMPLPDDEWAKGKCGFKGLQYMSLEIPTIMSPVGVNNEIIEDGINGFLATSDGDWFEKLSLLIENKALRKTIGREGRLTVEKKYSVSAHQKQYVQYFLNLMEIKKAL